MSNILEQQEEQQVTPNAELAAAEIKKNIRGLYKRLVRRYESQVNYLWNNGVSTPEEIVTALGTDAGEVFRLAGCLDTALQTALSGSTDKANAVQKPITVNEDGTVTINS